MIVSETRPPELKAVVAALGYSHGALSGPQQVVHCMQAAKGSSDRVDLTSMLACLWRQVFTRIEHDYLVRGNAPMVWIPPNGGFPAGGAAALFALPGAANWHAFGGDEVLGSVG
eukprot:585163-Amphidinium_carterae.1